MGKLKIQALILVLAFMSCTLAKAQLKLTLTYKIGSEPEQEVVSGETGQLATLLGEKAKTITELTIEGALNATDVKALRLMAGANEYDISVNTKWENIPQLLKDDKKWEEADFTKMQSQFGKLQTVDLSKATFVASANDEDNIFLTTCWNDQMNNINTKEVENEAKVKVTLPDYGLSKNVATDTKNLPQYIFSNCDNLVKVTLGENTDIISNGAFRNCDNLKECTNLNGNNTTIKEIGYSAFTYCQNFDIKSEANPTGSLPSNLEKLEANAFSYCAELVDGTEKGISAVIIPKSVTIIGGYAFENCRALKSVKFEDIEATEPELTIGYKAFCDTHSMVLQDNGQLPNRIINIDDLAFANTASTRIVVPKNDKLTGEKHTIKFNGVETAESGGLKTSAFGWSTNLEEVIIPSNITYISDGVFNDCKKLKTITWEDASKVTHIGNNAFATCESAENQFIGLTNVTSVGEGAFQNCKKLTDADAAVLLSKVSKIENITYQNCTSLTKIDINANVTEIGESAFSGDAAVTQVTVHGGTQIKSYWWKYQRHEDVLEKDEYGNPTKKKVYWQYDNINPFNGMEPNKVQVIFEDDAKDNYTNYRTSLDNNWYISNDENGNVKTVEKKDNPFMFLLTKTMESTTDTKKAYDVAPQLHADVKLTRTFKAGWNTLVLPFEMTRSDGKDDKGNGTGILKEALNTKNNDKFVVSVYRGLKENGDEEPCFMFLQYSDNWAGIFSFEPLLIRMTQDNIEAAENNTYTFTDVDVNFRHGANETYTAEEMPGIIGHNFNGDQIINAYKDYFTGNGKDSDKPGFKNCTYDKYYFTGTLTTQTITFEDDTYNKDAFLNVGDYIIQNNTFVRCSKGKGYGVKAFYGYFKRFHDDSNPGTTEPSAKQNIAIEYVANDGETTSIDEIDGTPVHTTNARIYNLNGQMVGTDASTLSKGIYIRNGKKFIVK